MSVLRRLRACALAVLAAFVLAGTLPRAGVYAHHHAGGDHAHVHPWGEDAVDDDDHDADHHHQHHDHADAGPGLEDPDGDHGVHVHWQAPFQHSTGPDAPRLAPARIVRRVAAPLRLAAAAVPARAAVARGPPSARVR